MVDYGRENIQGISFEIFLMEYRIWNPESDTLTIPRLSECEKLTNNVEVGNNEHNE